MRGWTIVLAACSAAPVAPQHRTEVVELAAGWGHTCARRDDGSVWCWGAGEDGQLGVDVPARFTPAPVEQLAGATRIIAGGTRTCGVVHGRVQCVDGGWPDVPVTHLAIGLWETCGVVRTGVIACVNTESKKRDEVTLDEPAEIGVGPGARCARLADRSVWCWWSGVAPARTLTDASSLAVGWTGSCAAKTDGTVWCWGNGYGDGPMGQTPARVPGVRDAEQVVAMREGACALVHGGTVTCWRQYERDKSTAVAGVRGATAIVAGDAHACALVRGDAVCWGEDNAGQLGREPFRRRMVREPVPGVSGAVELAAGDHCVCALDGHGEVTCWGSPLFSPDAAFEKTRVRELAGSKHLSLGYHHGCAILGDDTLACWGDNDRGQVGDGTTTPRNLPTVVPGLVHVVEVAAGYAHTCARTADGTASCWGNTAGQFGDHADSASAVVLATDASALHVESNATCVRRTGGWQCWGAREGRDFADALALGGVDGAHACKLVAGGAIRCTGYNADGELGDGSTTYHFHDWVDAALMGGVELAVAPARTCAIRADHSLWCWGWVTDAFDLTAPRKRDCNLGDGPSRPCIRTPTRVDIADVRAVALGTPTCALTGDGAVHCWGKAREWAGWGGVPDPYGPQPVVFR